FSSFSGVLTFSGLRALTLGVPGGSSILAGNTFGKERDMPTRSASAEWKGSLKEGSGTIRCASGEMEVPYSFGKRFGDVPGTNPEELVGAAHAGCFSMALAAALGRAGYTPE